MKRDMELVRRILLHVEQLDEATLRKQWLDIEGSDPATVAAHVQLLREANLVEALIYPPSGGPAQMAQVHRLTRAGHDFLEATRNDTTWRKTVDLVKEKGGALTLEILKAVALKVSMAQLGLPT